MFHYFSRSVNICSNYNFIHFKNFLPVLQHFTSFTRCGCCNVNAFIGCLMSVCVLDWPMRGECTQRMCVIFIASALFFYPCMYNILNTKSKIWIVKTVEMFILSFLQFLYTEHKTPSDFLQFNACISNTFVFLFPAVHRAVTNSRTHIVSHAHGIRTRPNQSTIFFIQFFFQLTND